MDRTLRDVAANAARYMACKWIQNLLLD